MAVNVAIDLDGTLDSFCAFFLPLLTAIKNDPEHSIRVIVLTGVKADKVTADDVTEKKTYLEELGYADLYDQLVLVAKPIDENKADFCQENDVRCLIDNTKDNLKALQSSCLGLLPWATRE